MRSFKHFIIIICAQLIHSVISFEDVNEELSYFENELQNLTQRNGRFLFPFKYYTPMNTASPLPTYQNQIMETEFDFIVIGSGSSGATLATRLSENPKWKVLLLEVGKEPTPLLNIPAIAASFQFTDYNWGYTMERQDRMCLGMIDQKMAWPRGRGLGGTSLINYMIHVRGNRGDYKRWEAAGNPGWGYKDVLPYFKKMEDSTVKYEDEGFHNRGGPVGVQDVPYRSPGVHAFVQSAIEAGHKYRDYNGKRQMGVSYVQAVTRKGLRQSVEVAYLRNARGRPNLYISTLSRATKLLMDDNKRVTGVQYVKNRQYHIATAKKEVILSAGTFNSPQLLILSGIGPKEHLEELGIPVVKDLPVGKLLYDHLTFLGLAFTVNETLTINQNELYDPNNLFRLLNQGDGVLTSLGGVEALVYLQTNVSRVTEKYPDMELIFVSGGLHTDSNLVYAKSFRIAPHVYDAIWKPLEGKQAWSVLPMLIHPHSRGFLKLKSTNPYHWPKLYGNFFTDPENLDVKTFIAAIRAVQKISNSPTFQRFGSTQVKTPVPGCGHIEWDTDEYWECALRHITGTLHHQIGTCKMGPSTDPEAVVDNKLKVYGINGLRVVDCSVIPIPLSAHTNTPAIMIGEKAADIIKQEYANEVPKDPKV